ncbi:MAG: metallophosphoesterase [Bacteroidales bacterium]|nr:metallophosphoesterase [Bacteroidales bacterium]
MRKRISLLLAFLMPLAAAAQSGILDFHPADEVVPLLEAARAPSVVWGKGKSAPALTLLHCSDIHGSAENLERIVEFRQAYSRWIEDAIHAGDAVYCYWDDPNPWDEVPSARGILNTVGNHDCWKGHLVWAQTSWPYDATEDEAYQLLFVGKDKSRPFFKEWDVVTPGGVCYYYKDYAPNGIRLIVLDCMHYTPLQHEWFCNVLEEARLKGLTVVCAQHYPPQNGMDLIESGFTDRDYAISAVPAPAAGEQMERMHDDAFSAVDGFIDDGGTFVCWLSGHTHLDFIGHVSGHQRQLMVIADKAGAKDDYMQEARPIGTIFQDSFNLVTVNPGRHTLVVQRIGCTRDQYMRSKRLFCYDYTTGNILVNE